MILRTNPPKISPRDKEDATFVFLFFPVKIFVLQPQVLEITSCKLEDQRCKLENEDEYLHASNGTIICFYSSS